MKLLSLIIFVLLTLNAFGRGGVNVSTAIGRTDLKYRIGTNNSNLSGQPYFPSQPNDPRATTMPYPNTNDCIYCNRGRNNYVQPYYTYPIRANYGNYYPRQQTPWAHRPWMPWGETPWFSDYGNYRYSNYQSPGLTNQWPRYPGGGGAVAMKPNIYLSGRVGTSFNIDVEFARDSNLLIASPALSKGWKGQIVGNGKVEVDGAIYPYLYYDYRVGEENLQLQKGFCGNKRDVITKMGILLESSGFKPVEIMDFNKHWPEKLHYSDSYCVFPQDNNQLQEKVKLKITPSVHHLMQLNFVIVLKKGKYKDMKAKKYLLNPRFISTRSKNDFEIREWGVIFLTSN